MQLQGKVALVTGADSGIGQAIAVLFAQQGADVAICYHTDGRRARPRRSGRSRQPAAAPSWRSPM